MSDEEFLAARRPLTADVIRQVYKRLVRACSQMGGVVRRHELEETVVNQQAPALEDRVLAELHRKPGLKAAELAAFLDVERREVNRCLAYELAGKVQQGSDYRWRPVESARPAVAAAQTAATTEIAKLCRYFLECIDQDMDEGVSTFPDDPAIVRLVGAMMIEQNDEWSLNRRYMQLEGLQTLSDTAPNRLPAVAR